jgi:hypothetical protein
MKLILLIPILFASISSPKSKIKIPDVSLTLVTIEQGTSIVDGVDTNRIFVVTIAIKNLEKKQLLLPSSINYGFKKDVFSDMVFELNEVIGQSVVEIEPSGDYHNLENEFGKRYDTLKKGEEKRHRFSLSSFYDFGIRHFKIRARFTIPKINKLGYKFIYSPWLFFNVDSSSVVLPKK